MKGLYLKEEYISHIPKLKIRYDFSSSNILVAHGCKDFNFKSKYVTDFVKVNMCKYIEIPDGCHLFESNPARKELFNQTISFINEN